MNVNGRRNRALLGLLAGALGGAALLVALLMWYLWRGSMVAEENRTRELARDLGERAEAVILDARDMLDRFNGLDVEACSEEHLRILREAAVTRPHIRAIGYWRAADRLCGVGFVQGAALTPPRADRIYESGVIAWWPGPDTRIGEVELFLMRYGEHDVAIDPRLLLDNMPGEGQRAGLWVEGLPMTVVPAGAAVPTLDEVPSGLTVDGENDRLLSRFSLGTLLPIDIVVVQPMAQFWQRYLPTLVMAAIIGAGLLAIWVYAMLRYSRHHLSLAAELRDAIGSGGITVVYQPIIDLRTGHCTGAEALARWLREDGETVSPDVFIPVAEQAEMISEITLCVLDRILEDLGDLLRENAGLAINLNLASQDLASESLARGIAERLATAGVAAGSLKLEITERALVDSDLARERIRALRSVGHQVAIDDFGTGYSSLSYLESFDLDCLKIDKVFVDAIDTHAVTSSVIGHIIEMARSLKLAMVAEGIESVHQKEWLRRQGVESGQGYYFSRPVSPRQFRRFLRRHQPDE